MGFRLDWFSGASAQIELFSTPTRGGYQLKYTPAFRTTIRPPVQERPLGPPELSPIDDEIDRVVQGLNTRHGAGTGVPAGGSVQVDSSFVEGMAIAGGLLLNVTLPPYVQADLRNPGLFLEMGMDEGLLGYPWELMHDGEDFLCLKHLFGRFINATGAVPAPISTNNADRTDLGKVSVLLIVVSAPLARGMNPPLPRLPEATAEADEITKVLTSMPGDVSLKVLSEKDAKLTTVAAELNKNKYHIVHFCGHAQFDQTSPRSSSLALYDRDMTTGYILPYFQQARPILCFINACESASAEISKEHFNVIGLGRSFLETGAYLLGARWKVGDKGAGTFAKAFYESLLSRELSLGAAVREARLVCRKMLPVDDLAWASYVLYGDPRLHFRRMP